MQCRLILQLIWNLSCQTLFFGSFHYTLLIYSFHIFISLFQWLISLKVYHCYVFSSSKSITTYFSSEVVAWVVFGWSGDVFVFFPWFIYGLVHGEFIFFWLHHVKVLFFLQHCLIMFVHAGSSNCTIQIFRCHLYLCVFSASSGVFFLFFFCCPRFSFGLF